MVVFVGAIGCFYVYVMVSRESLKKEASDDEPESGCYNRGEYEKAVVYYKKVINAMRSVPGNRNTEVLGVTLYKLARCYMHLHEHSKAIATCKEALKVNKAFVPEHSTIIGDIHVVLGDAYHEQRKYNKTIEHYKLAITTYLYNPGKQHETTGDTFYKLGIVYEKNNNEEEATKCYREALKIKELRLGGEHKDVVRLRCMLDILEKGVSKKKEEKTAGWVWIDSVLDVLLLILSVGISLFLIEKYPPCVGGTISLVRKFGRLV